MRMRNIGFLFAFLFISASVFAQGVQTGTIRGTVKDQQDLAVPGVTVTVILAGASGRPQRDLRRAGWLCLS